MTSTPLPSEQGEELTGRASPVQGQRVSKGDAVRGVLGALFLIGMLAKLIGAVFGHGQGYIDRHFDDVDRTSYEYADRFAAGLQTLASNGEEAVDRCTDLGRMWIASNGLPADHSRHIGCIEGSAEALSLNPDEMLRAYHDTH